MEGKGVLFKKFAGIDVFDIAVDATDAKKFIEVVKALEPTFGGINLEDIKAPESFEIEETLRREMNIPIMHDDQHGTAIISSAALLSALELVEKNIQDLRITDDKHVMAIDLGKNKDKADELEGLLKDSGAVEVNDKEVED